jgi:hypothetical protein
MPQDKKPRETAVYEPKLTVDLRDPKLKANLPAVKREVDADVRIRDIPMALDDLMNFGRYNGVKIKDLINSYPRYVYWCIENVDWFWLDKEAYKYWRARMSLEAERAEQAAEDCLCDDRDGPMDFCDCP